MVTPLYLELHQTHGKVFDKEPEFFQLCIENLGFLVTEYGFDFECKHDRAAETFMLAKFINHDTQLTFVVIWDWHSMPTLGVGPIERKYFERGMLPEFNKDEYNRRSASNDLEYNSRFEEKIKLMGSWVRENLEKLTKQT
jgi:hypothetical protein